MAKELILIPKFKYEKLLKRMDSEIPINSNSEKLPCDQSFEMKSQLDICNGSTKNSNDNEDTILQTGSGVTNVFKIKKTKSSRGPLGIPTVKRKKTLQWIKY